MGKFDFSFFIVLMIFSVKKLHILLLVILAWLHWSFFTSNLYAFLYKVVVIDANPADVGLSDVE